jgi:hypothetical protein
MKNNLIIGCIGLVLALVLFGVGFFVGKKSVTPKTVEVVKTEIKYLKPGLDTLPPAEAYKQLTECYNSPIALSYKIKNTEVLVTASDGCKQTTDAVKISCGSSKNYKFYLGLGIGAAIIAGSVYGATKLLK